MAASARFELASSSAEGSTSATGYANGQRGSYGSANLDRSGSLRESFESRALNSSPNMSRGGVSSNAEIPLLYQYLSLNPFSMSMGDQKFTRFGELRRVLGVGIATEEHPSGAVHFKPLPTVALEEVKRFKTSLLETSTGARDRANMLNESILKLDKYQHFLLSKKRLRNENPSSERSNGLLLGDRSALGVNLLKMGMQSHQNPSEIVPQRSEGRNKNVLQNKRTRTSMVEVQSDGRYTGFSRSSGVIDKERDMLKSGNGSSMEAEDKTRGLPVGGDGWEKKMKRKRSVGTMVARTMAGGQELKRVMPQRLLNETRLRSCDGHGFRRGTSNGTIGINKLDGSAQPSNIPARLTSRNDLDNASLANNKRDHAVGSDKDRVTTKVNNKLNISADNQVGSPTPVTKGKASRAPRTGSGVLANPSPNFLRTSGAPDGWEHPLSTNKAQSIGVVHNRKRPMPTRSSSPPVAQWVGQRPQKISRVARRTNLVPPLSIREEEQILSDGFPASDTGSRLTTSKANGPGFPKRVANTSQQLKLKLANISSPAGLSESEESGAGENKSKEKGEGNGEVEEKAANGIQKIATLKKSKILLKEEVADGVRRQGRTGRGSAQSRAFVSPTREKLESSANVKPLRSTKPGSDKTESKSGRPPTKKFSDRKALSHPGVLVNNGSTEFTGESEDDHEELLAAGRFACNASYLACSSSFWKKMEPIFSFISSEDLTYLKQQISLVEEFDRGLYQMSATDQYGKGGDHFNGIVLNESARTASSVDGSRDTNALPRKLGTERWFGNIIPLSQRLLAALIIEDDVDEFNRNSGREDDFPYSSDDSPCSHIDSEPRDMGRIESEIESELEIKSTASNNFRSPSNRLHSDEVLQEDDILVHSEVGIYIELGRDNLGASQPMHTVISGISSMECHYQQIGLDERILLELHSIGLFPEAVPDLAQGEDEEISKDISELKEDLYQQARVKKGWLGKLERAALEGRNIEEREFERFAMNKLVEISYKKHMACRGNNGSSNKGGASKVMKQAALAFTKRTLARYQQFEVTGRSCFSEPAFRDALFSAPLFKSDAKSVGSIREGRAANLYAETLNCLQESRVSGFVIERRGHNNDNLNSDPSDAFQVLTHTSDHSIEKDEPLSNRGKKKELLLDDVGNVVPRATSVLGSYHLGGTKGKRSERDRNQNKDIMRNSAAKVGRPSLGNVRAERKNKTKPRQKTAQLSTSVSDLVGRLPETSSSMLPSQASSKTVVSGSSRLNGEARSVGPGGIAQDPFNDIAESIDLTNLQLHGIDSVEGLGVSDVLDAHGQDLNSWFNFDDDGLQEQDQDFMGLEIPMDDLSELNMII